MGRIRISGAVQHGAILRCIFQNMLKSDFSVPPCPPNDRMKEGSDLDRQGNLISLKN
jgi:hypothetical protein